MLVHSLPNGEIWQGRVEEAYPRLGGVDLIISDGPYGMQLADWDRMAKGDLGAFYEPHVVAWGAITKPSASLYFWNTHEGWANVHPVLVRHGWKYRSLITWVKPNAQSIKGASSYRTWADVTEVCGFYQRDEIDSVNPIRDWLMQERERSGLTMGFLDERVRALGGAGNMVRHWFTVSQWGLPSARHWIMLHSIMNEGVSSGFFLQRHQERRYTERELLEEHVQLRKELRENRTFFEPQGVYNVWEHLAIQGRERVRDERGVSIHPCQKPVVFAERMIRASAPRGGKVFAPFGGTCREAFAVERICREDPGRVTQVTTEQDLDGKDYIRHSMRQILRETAQTSLFALLSRQERVNEADEDSP